MCGIEAELKVNSFFVMDENFLLHRTRAMRLLELMKQSGKSWELSVFASANAIRKYTMLELVELGVSWVWMGSGISQGRLSQAAGRRRRGNSRANFANTAFACRAQPSSDSSTIRPTTSSRKSNAAVGYQTDFHQFMLYTPVPGTPLYQEMAEQGRLLTDIDSADIHGQFKFNFRHAAISREDSKTISGLGVLARFREQWSEPLSHVPDHAAWAGNATRTTPIRASASGSRAKRRS